MTVAKDVRDYLISKDPSFIAYEQAGGAGFVSTLFMPDDKDNAGKYIITIVSSKGLPRGPDRIKKKGIYILIRAREDEVDRQETDDDTIFDLLDRCGPFIVNGHAYKNIISDSSGATSLGWQGEGQNMVRYTSHDYIVML